MQSKSPTRCNTSISVLLQDHSTCFGNFRTHHQEYNKLWFTATGKPYFPIPRECSRKIPLDCVHDLVVRHFTVAELGSVLVARILEYIEYTEL
jgi:hypothetical protein